jgi:hypothetical protein
MATDHKYLLVDSLLLQIVRQLLRKIPHEVLGPVEVFLSWDYLREWKLCFELGDCEI